MTESTPTLRLVGLTKRYAGLVALDQVDLEVHAGEILALLGENGAGKSTLAKIVAGATSQDEGRIELEGEEVRFGSPADAATAGVGMVYQENALVDTMSVMQNLFLRDAGVVNHLGRRKAEARHVLVSHNFYIDPAAPVATLGAAQKQMVEITRVVHSAAKVIIFDEPTASVTPQEARQLFLSMHELRQAGHAIVFITHNLEEALQHSDRVTVMRDGVVQLTAPTAEMTRERIVRSMVGRDVEYARHAGTRRPSAHPVLEIDNLTMGNVVRNMTFSAYAGEVVVLAGLVGAGRTETAMIAFGALKRRRLGGGEVRLDGRPVRFRSPRQAIRAGIAYITEDRKTLGIFTDLSIYENIMVGDLGASRRITPRISRERLRNLGSAMVDRFKIRTLNPDRAKLVELSGGNQQKVLLAKSLTKVPRVVIFDEPTRGVDVGAIEDIHAAIRELAEQGAAVVVISSYLPEVLALADRVLVAQGGRVVAELSGDEATEERIMFAAVY